MADLIVRIDTATRRITPGHISAAGPFTKPPLAGEQDVALTLESAQPPATADGRRNWTWCRLTSDLATVELDPELVPAVPTSGEHYDNLPKWIKAVALALGTHPALGLTPAQVKARVVAAYEQLP